MEALKLIPQLFYDMIARVIPGALAIVLVAEAADLKLGVLVNKFWDGAAAVQQSVLFFSFGFILAAYVVGQILSPISDFLESRVVKKLFPRYYHVLKNAISEGSEYSPAVRKFLLKELGCEKETDAKGMSAAVASKAIFVWFDWLRVTDQDAGARAAKIRAEYRMHIQNSVVFFCALVIDLTAVLIHWRLFNPVLIVLLTLAGIISLWATARTHRAFQWAVLQQYYAVKMCSPVVKAPRA